MLKQDMYVFGVHSTYMYMTCFITFDMQLHKEVWISTATADSKLWATLTRVCGRMRKRIVQLQLQLQLQLFNRRRRIFMSDGMSESL